MVGNPSGSAGTRFYELVHILTWRNLKVRYRGSVLGIYWSLLNPIIMTAVYAAIFSATFARYYQGSPLRYALAVFIGLVAVNFFSSATLQALPTVVSGGMLLNKIKLPPAIFPISMVTAHAFQLVVGNLPALAIITVLIARNPYHLLLLPLPIAAVIILSMGVAFFVSSLYVFFRDIPYLYELVTFLLWLTVPIFYPAAIVPEQIRAYLWLNPLYPVIESLRQIALDRAMPDLRLIGIAWLEALIVLALGWLVFAANRRKFMDFV